MPILENPRHEAFCAARAAGNTIDESYKLAGYSDNRANAQRLSTKQHIKARITELQAHVAENFEVTIEHLASQLDADRQFAYQCKSPSAAVAATVAKAKLFGYMVDRASVNVTHNYAMMTEEELRFEIAAINAEARALKAGVQH